MPEVTRFAPSPTGPLHLGHALAALVAARASEPGGRFLLRIEDLDPSRCRPEFEAGILEDLRWLGLSWSGPPLRQSDRSPAYRAALDRLRARDLLYPCFCTRREIRQKIARIGSAPHHLLEPDGDGPPYPGTCRRLPRSAAWARARCEDHALRLDLAAAQALHPGPSTWCEPGHGQPFALDPGRFGDAVLARKDGAVAYHLAVVVDDAFQGITLVTRGEDLRPATSLHRLLQQLLDLPQPRWLHHPLVRDTRGQRLAKRHDALALSTLREQGSGAAEIIDRLQTDLARAIPPTHCTPPSP